MITIEIGSNTSDNRSLDKTVTNITTVQGVLKEGTSILSPVIRIEGSLSDLIGANYMNIPGFGRKYFITDIQSVTNSLVEISGKVDVLSTYKTQIRACSGLISRNENAYDLYLNDGAIEVYQNPDIEYLEFESGFSIWNYIFTIASKNHR